MSTPSTPSPSIAFLGLATEYCRLLESASTVPTEPADLVARALSLLPRLYITIADLDTYDALLADDGTYLGTYLDENSYEQLRSALAAILAEDDTYLETFEDDMKYSDTPIAASISEGLADIYQDLFNCLMIVRDSDGRLAPQAIAQCKENFINYWSQTLCNLLRPLNSIKYRQ